MNKLILIAIVFSVAGCKEKFLSPVTNSNTGFLVVEGVINNGGEQTNIRLSRTTGLTENGFISETGATVRLESSSNTFFYLTENAAGNYFIGNLLLDTLLKYRLAITTGNNEEYISEYVPVRNNPPIDSISWVREDDGVQIFINTHDPQNNTRYYQWDFNETWEFHSAYYASLKYEKGPPPNYDNIGVTYRDLADPEMYICWKDNSSTSLILGSSEKLSQDIIHLPITLIENNAQKLSVKYSILVNQYSWSKAGYEFLQRMKKNTESVGSVFDPQPSELNGNIYCTSDPNKSVIGFFNICTIQSKRIFIKNSELPVWGYRASCMQWIVKNNADSIAANAQGLLPTTPDQIRGFSIVTFNASEPLCVDCTLSGTNVKPIFWP
jgi:hypothetical protein